MPTAEEPSPGDPNEVGQYRAISGWAIAACGLGLAAALAWIGPILWIVPLLGIVASIVALAQIRRSQNLLAGRRVAVVGLCLSLLLGAGSASHYLTRLWMLTGRAEQFAEQWLHFLLAGRPRHAHELALSHLVRRPLDDDLDKSDSDSAEQRADYEGFLKRPPVPKLLGAGPEADLERLQREISTRRGGLETLRLAYRVKVPSGVVRVAITIDRDVDQSGAEQWRIADFREGG